MSAKRVAFAALLCLGAVLGWPGQARADEPGAGRRPSMSELVQGQAERLDDGEFQRLLDQVSRDAGGYAPRIDWREAVSQVSAGREGIDVRGLARGVATYLFRETVANTRLLGKLIILAVAVALLEKMGSSFDSRGVSELASSACHLALVVVAAGSFAYSVAVARDLIAGMVRMMNAVLPTLIALIAASGAPVTAGLLQPVMVATVYAVSAVTSDYVLVLLTLAAVLDIVGHVVRPFNVSGLAALLRQASMLVMGLCLAAFLGVVAVNRVAGAVADGIALRSAKFLSGTFVPVVGKMFADAIEMVFASSYILRNAVGIAGAAAVVTAAAFPLCKIVSLVAVYRIAAALVQPVGAETLSDCLNGIASSLTGISVAAGSVAVMFVVAVATLAVAARPP
ncbi:MAG: stage III sporulation protein AE [Firmicutes bacterium]|nr:stage III sporulation protein AE [Bacillota bacterium]